MPGPSRILTSPVRVSGSMRLAHLSVLVAADALQRRARALGQDPQLSVPSLAGDLAGQASVERELAREGHDRVTLGRSAFVERVRETEASLRARAADELALIGVTADLEAGAVDGSASVSAARNAFVRLFEAGLLVREERVVDVCTRCETVVDPADADPTDLAAEVLHLRLGEEGTEIDLDVVSAEFVPGAVAVVVPTGHPAIGDQVHLPYVGDVPVIEDPDATASRVLFPAHDAVDLDLARRLGLPALHVLDRDGVVEIDGPLKGVGRFAARQAASKALEDEGLLVGRREGVEPSLRCRRCGTVLVPHLGPHWFLPMSDLEIAAADAVRDGLVEVVPGIARDAFLSRAGQGGDWCLSHQVWAGEAVPAAECTECRKMTVAVDVGGSCSRCMGALEPVDDVLDARFLAAVWPLAVAGWPEDDAQLKETAPDAILVVDGPGVSRWAVAMVALGLRLTGSVPFGRVAAQELQATDDDRDPMLATSLEELVGYEDPRVVRLALLAGGLDLDLARAAIDLLADPVVGDADFDGLVEAYDAAFAAGTPASALLLVGDALRAGIRPELAERLRALAAPLIGA